MELVPIDQSVFYQKGSNCTVFAKGKEDALGNWQLLQTSKIDISDEKSMKPFCFRSFIVSKEQCPNLQCQIKFIVFFCVLEKNPQCLTSSTSYKVLNLMPARITLQLCLTLNSSMLKWKSQLYSIMNWLMESWFCFNKGTCKTLLKTTGPEKWEW